MSRLDGEKINVEYDNLVNREGDVGHITLAAGQGKLRRRSVIDSEGKLLTTGGKASYILAEDVDATETVTAAVYKNGNYVKNSLIVNSEYILKKSDIDNLRSVGIIVEEAF